MKYGSGRYLKLSDSVAQGEFRKFLLANHFLPKGKRKVLFVGFLNGRPCTVSFHYHKGSEIIPKGTLSAMARQLGVDKERLISMIKGR